MKFSELARLSVTVRGSLTMQSSISPSYFSVISVFFFFLIWFCKKRKMDVVDAGRVIELNEDTEATPASMS